MRTNGEIKLEIKRVEKDLNGLSISLKNIQAKLKIARIQFQRNKKVLNAKEFDVKTKNDLLTKKAIELNRAI